ncbi:MAG: hypothetical protein SFW65_08030 [Alphaproteobacteria bacterium]|nr:hypothetical protein [Alphaproteobacteria bacterium]
MKLLDDIIEIATSKEASVADVLRKLLVLSYKLKNERLKTWAQNELDGYRKNEEVIPDYRKITAHAKGIFLGPFGQQLNDQPIPAGILKKEHRHFAESAILNQPIAAYEGNNDPKNKCIIEWPGNLVVLYQAKFFDGDLALNRAWQEIPNSVMISLVETVRNKVLKFALELADEIGDQPEEAIRTVPAEKIDRLVTLQIYGGQVIFAANTGDIVSDSSVKVISGDLKSLKAALKLAGASEEELVALTTAIEEDKKHQNAEKPSIGSKTLKWLSDVSGKVAGKIAERLIAQYLGLP